VAAPGLILIPSFVGVVAGRMVRLAHLIRWVPHRHMQPRNFQAARFQRTSQAAQALAQQAPCLIARGFEPSVHLGATQFESNLEVTQGFGPQTERDGSAALT
jgi:hypothetical protein